jgi:ammonium transporter, Amt family
MADAGSNAWIMTSSALMLLPALPGAALYYGGATHKNNILPTLMQLLSLSGLITLLWLFFAYSLAFAPTYNPTLGRGNPTQSNVFLGDSSRFWLIGLTKDTINEAGWSTNLVSETVYIVYMLTYAILTAVFSAGYFCNRLKWHSMMIFFFIWLICIWVPIAHWNWHANGYLYKTGVMNFAGGNVVHITAGLTGMALLLLVGNHKTLYPPHLSTETTICTTIGMMLMYVGIAWGMNGGAQYESETGIAGMATLNTLLATSMGSLTWALVESFMTGKSPTTMGALNDAMAGMITVTPGSGIIDPTGGFWYGAFAGPCLYFAAKLKSRLGYSFGVDMFGMHAVGGTLGALLTAFFCSKRVNSIETNAER